jgi:hypothetical protein
LLYERRRAERAKVNLDAHWEGAPAQCAGLVVDISLTGCFILTSDLVKTDELVRLEIRLPEGKTVYVWGEVVYQMSEIGFGVRFTLLTQDEAQPLDKLLRSAKEAKEAKKSARSRPVRKSPSSIRA